MLFLIYVIDADDGTRSLAYCELYVTIGTIVRRFAKLQGNELTAEDLIYEDYFSSYNPIAAKKFHVCKEAECLVK